MRLARLEAEQRQIDAANATDQPGERIVQHLVTPDVVAGVVSHWTGVPVQRLLATEAQQLLNLEATLGKAVVGQPRAVKTVSQAVLRSRAGLADPDKPTGVFMFFGCSGTGSKWFFRWDCACMFPLSDQTRNLLHCRNSAGENAGVAAV